MNASYSLNVEVAMRCWSLVCLQTLEHTVSALQCHVLRMTLTTRVSEQNGKQVTSHVAATVGV